jgi:NAD(P)H-hydrate epimerase
MWIASAAHSREIDRRAQEEFGVPAMVLMERAGLAVFNELRKMIPPTGTVAVVCGKGNNGGDGFVMARLAIEHGYFVDCLVVAENEKELKGEAFEQMLQAKAQGVNPIYYPDPRWAQKMDCVGCRDLIVDAILGTGAKGELKEPVLDAVQAINRSGVPVLAVDVPSGIVCDTGEELTDSVWATRTITMGQPKQFLFQGIGLEHSGEWSVAKIGYPRELLNEPTDAQMLNCDWVRGLVPERLKSSHKGSNGNVLVVAGSDDLRGAGVLASLAAARSGAGLVTFAGVESAVRAVINHLPEATFIVLPEKDGQISPDAAPVLLERSTKADSLVVGPGLGQSDSISDFLRSLFKEWDRPAVLDADALNAVAQGVELPQAPTVLTPHPGEMSRLLKCSIAEVEADRFTIVRQAVNKYDATILLKGPHSIVGESEEAFLVNSTGNPGMASGGIGDVLSGLIGTLLAQDLPPYFAASVGMFWHGEAGDVCAKELGEVGYLAHDLANALPKARVKLTASCDEDS